MIGSTTPAAEQADWHPVHRANAMLRAALLSSTRTAEPPVESEAGEGEPGIVDVHSGSKAIALDGTPYSEW